MSATPPSLYVSFFLHANLQYAELPAAAAPAVVAQSYRPVCALFLGRPWARAVFEFSGYTLEILAADYPDVIHSLRVLVGRGQIELCASTYANPILPLIPLDHGRRQIAAFQRVYERIFGDLGVVPAGFFPQEFALDPASLALVSAAGYSWAPLMLNHYLECLGGRLNTAGDLPLRAPVDPRLAPEPDLLHSVGLRGAKGSRLSGVLNLPQMIDMLFELANGEIGLDEAVDLVRIHHRRLRGGPGFIFLGPSDMEFVGLDLRAYIPDWRWPRPISADLLGALLDELRELPFVRFATAREYLAANPAAGEPLYLRCGSDHPLLTPWSTDPDNQRLNELCREADGLLRAAEQLRPAPGADPEIDALLERGWRAMLLAENSDGRGWAPIPERRLFCYDQALDAIALAEAALSRMRAGR
jgi:hypothetical protein